MTLLTVSAFKSSAVRKDNGVTMINKSSTDVKDMIHDPADTWKNSSKLFPEFLSSFGLDLTMQDFGFTSF